MGRTILSALILSFMLAGCVSLPLVDRTSKSEAPGQEAQPAQQVQPGADAAQGSKEAPQQQDAVQSGQEQVNPTASTSSASEPATNQPTATQSEAFSAAVAPPPEAPAAEPEKKSYVIKKGDSLWSIACDELKDCYRWQEIQHANPDLDPKDIQPGQELTLP